MLASGRLDDKLAEELMAMTDSLMLNGMYTINPKPLYTFQSEPTTHQFEPHNHHDGWILICPRYSIRQLGHSSSALPFIWQSEYLHLVGFLRLMTLVPSHANPGSRNACAAEVELKDSSGIHSPL